MQRMVSKNVCMSMTKDHGMETYVSKKKQRQRDCETISHIQKY